MIAAVYLTILKMQAFRSKTIRNANKFQISNLKKTLFQLYQPTTLMKVIMKPGKEKIFDNQEYFSKE